MGLWKKKDEKGKQKEGAVHTCLSNHAIHCKSVFLQSYKIMLQLLIKIHFFL